MTKRIFRAICTVAICVFLVSAVFIMGVLYEDFSNMQQDQLRIQLELAAQGVANEGIGYFDDLHTDVYRMTWVSGDGTVLYDTGSDAASMDSHLNREEIDEAMHEGYGESSRYSDTLTERLFYMAKRLPDGTVLRLAGAHDTVWVLFLGIIQAVAVAAALAVLLSLVLAFRLSKAIVRPLNELNLEKPQMNKEYQELQPLLDRIDSQQQQLQQQSFKIQRKRDEFHAVTGNMKEGLVLLNEQGIILSINQAASELLAISSYCIGKDILMLNNSMELQELLRQAKSGGHPHAPMRVGELEYQVNASPVMSEGAVAGIVLLIFDITEKQKAEQMRREFTANVSHELKTPLHSISGYAELLKDGIVRPDDIILFSKRIYAEVQRMIALVDDIINLSHLDEGAEELPWEDTDLYGLTETVLQRLMQEAQTAGVSVTLTGTAAVLHGVPQLLEGIIYNLCDNAIKYNRPGGSVSVEVKDAEDQVILTVSDTGIGIPQEHRERVFERFYRVDKSHSKEVGGTGLGLSIVKHSARLHNAVIDLYSVAEGGTTVTVSFPKRGKAI